MGWSHCAGLLFIDKLTGDPNKGVDGFISSLVFLSWISPSIVLCSWFCF